MPDASPLEAGAERAAGLSAGAPSALELKLYRLEQWLRSPRPYLMLLGYGLLVGFWYLSVEVLRLPRFAEMPGPTAVFREWLSAAPTYGVSIHTAVYYQHILISLQRVAIAFAFATLLGVPDRALSRMVEDFSAIMSFRCSRCCGRSPSWPGSRSRSSCSPATNCPFSS